MTAIIKNKFRLKSAKNFVENFEVPAVLSDASLTPSQKQSISQKLPNRNHYLFIGKPFGWDTSTPSTDTNSFTELNPPPPQDTQDTDARVWDEMLGLKKIVRGDVSLVIPRSDWRPNTVYAQFDSTDPSLYRQPTPERIQQELSNTPLGSPVRRAGNFYALNNLLELFICVSNNNGQISTIEPRKPPTTGPDSNLNGRFETQDGYIWQYITSITSGDAVKFLTDKWIPIRTLPANAGIGNPQEDVQSNAIPGELLRVDVISTGSTGNFTNKFSGKIMRHSSDSKKAIFGTNSATPSTTSSAYTGYELHVVVSPTVTKKYKVTDYVTSPRATLTLSADLTDLSLDVEYDCKILPLITVNSDGAPITVVPILDEVTSKLVGVDIVDPGSNASTVNFTINRPTVFSGDLPSLKAVMSPRLGLGRDPESDLGAFFAMVSTQLKYEEDGGDFTISNDYRQVGIIRDVKKLEKNSSNEDVVVLATENTLNAVKIVNVSFELPSKLGPNELGFQPDQLVDIYSPSSPTPLIPVGQARVVQFVRNPDVGSLISGKLHILQTKETNYYQVKENDTISFSSGVNAVTATVFAPNASEPAVKPEEFLKFHGDILYLENRRAILRAQDQIEDIKTIIEF